MSKQLVKVYRFAGGGGFQKGFDRIGGLRILGPLHTLAAFFFLAFLVVHLYLSTTGSTPLELTKEMIFGYGEVHDDGAGEIHKEET